ncbi:MAG: hypothetical protein ABWW69_00495 [Pyrodictiaceae archaeon]
MHNETLIKLFSSAFIAVATAVAIFVITAVLVSGLEALSKPYILAPIGSVLGSGATYLEMLGCKKSSKSLRYIGRTLIAISLAILALLITKFVVIL